MWWATTSCSSRAMRARSPRAACSSSVSAMTRLDAARCRGLLAGLGGRLRPRPPRPSGRQGHAEVPAAAVGRAERRDRADHERHDDRHPDPAAAVAAEQVTHRRPGPPARPRRRRRARKERQQHRCRDHDRAATSWIRARATGQRRAQRQQHARRMRRRPSRVRSIDLDHGRDGEQPGRHERPVGRSRDRAAPARAVDGAVDGSHVPHVRDAATWRHPAGCVWRLPPGSDVGPPSPSGGRRRRLPGVTTPRVELRSIHVHGRDDRGARTDEAFRLGRSPSTTCPSPSRPGQVTGFVGPNGAGKSTTCA